MRIGLTQRVLYHRGRAYDAVEHAWYEFLQDHKPIFIPNTLDQDFDALAESLDCLIITGGDDSAIRRTTELRLARTMMMQHRPILGVCHGAFLLTDVLGGQVTEVTGHSDTEHIVNYFGQLIQVNSYHNLAIKQPHSQARVLALDSDGHTEAWVDGTLAGIVWHPERMREPFIPAEIQHIMRL